MESETGGTGQGGSTGGSGNGGASGRAGDGPGAQGGVGGSAAVGGDAGSALGGVGGIGGAGGAVGGVGGAGGSVGGVGGVGGSVGGSAASGGDAGIAGSLGGTAGDAGAAGAPGCVDPDGAVQPMSGASVASTTVGENGSFTDTCDENGNLVEYVCEMAPCTVQRIIPATGGQGTGGTSACLPMASGQVVPLSIDCAGHCRDGACFGWCASFGDTFTVTAVAANGLEMSRGDDAYSCSVVFQRDGYDCLGASLMGRELVVTSLGACVGASTTFGWDDLDDPATEECAFTCTLLD